MCLINANKKTKFLKKDIKKGDTQRVPPFLFVFLKMKNIVLLADRQTFFAHHSPYRIAVMCLLIKLRFGIHPS